MAGPCGILTRFPILLLSRNHKQAPEAKADCQKRPLLYLTLKGKASSPQATNSSPQSSPPSSPEARSKLAPSSLEARPKLADVTRNRPHFLNQAFFEIICIAIWEMEASMYCPKCGQQFAPDIRFCSRCGMPLNEVTTLVANNGLTGSSHRAANQSSPQKKAMRLGAKLMFGGLALLPPFFGLCFPADNPAPLLVPFTVFFGGLCLRLYSRMFGGEDIPLGQQASQAATAQSQAYLPPDHSKAPLFDVRTVNTAETAPPPSVTDHTTKIFDRQ